MSREKAIELAAVNKSYGRNKVLDGLNMTVYRNNVYAFLGNNGEGKTTAIKMMAGQSEPDSGSIRIFGLHPVTESARLKPRLSYLAELMRVYDNMTLNELRNLLKALYTTWDDSMYRELVQRCDLPADRNVGSFSRGMYAGALLILGVCRKPELLLLDDPFLGLDTASRRNFSEILVGTLTAFDCTVLISTHQIPEIAGIVDRIGILSGARLAVEADTQELEEQIRLLKLPVASANLLPELDVIRKQTSGPELLLTIRGQADELSAKLSRISGLAFELEPVSLEEIFLAFSS